jgi:hypothetical protein
METTGETLFQVKKERSYISSLVNGCSYGFKHLGLLLRYIWPSVLLTCILPIPFVFFFAAQMDAILRKWIELGYIPNVTLKTMRSDIAKCAGRSAVKVAIYIFWTLFALLFFYLPMFFGMSIWWGWLAIFVVWLLLLPLSFVIMQVSYSDIAISECFIGGFKTAYRNFGKLFAFEFLSNLLIMIIVLGGCIPCLVISAVCLQAYNGSLMGDVLDLPVLFPLYVILADVIGVAIMLVTLLVFSFSRCLLWGSLVNEVPTETEANS